MGCSSTEDVSFNFTEITWPYTQYDETKGTNKGQTTGTWDLTNPGPS